MGWLNRKKEELPEELKDMSEEQILEAAKELRANKDKLASLEASIGEKDKQLTQTRTEMDSIKSKLSEIEANTDKGQASTNTEIPSVIEDEEEAFRRRLGPVADVALHAAMLGAQRSAKDSIFSNPRNAAMYRKFEGEIESLMAKEPPMRRATPEGWIVAFNYIRGLHMDEIISKPDEFFSETPFSQKVVETKDKKDEISDEERRIALKMEISPEEYMKQKKSIQVYQG